MTRQLVKDESEREVRQVTRLFSCAEVCIMKEVLAGCNEGMKW